MAVFGHNVIEAAGIVALLYVGSKVLWGVWQTARLYLFSGRLAIGSLDLRSYAGRWAVVTGSTDGIGKAYAEQLAARGLNIVLISRSKDKLEAVAAEIVNNVGMTPFAIPDFFLNCEDEVYEKTVHCNVNSMIMMTKIVLPGMVKRKTGVIINLSSILATAPAPLMAVYAGTKAFALQFSKSLAVEYKDKGVIIQAVTPSFVSTKMTGRISTNFFVTTPTSFVRSALNTVGLANQTSGCFSHSLQVWLFTQDVFCEWVKLPAMKKFREFSMKRRQSKKEK
ncbi:very-long-chain 3-oxoacyl-CoA reductase-like isoform X3 [Branchiostoma floridae x Branchiostoma belcheri]